MAARSETAIRDTETRDLRTRLGFAGNQSVLPDPDHVLPVIRLKMLSTGFRVGDALGADRLTTLSADLVRKINSKFRAYPAPLCPTDQRLQDWLDRHLGDVKTPGGRGVRLPDNTLHMDFHGLARTLSLPQGGDTFVSPLLQSTRVQQGVLHNPASDKRTTQGTFHVAEGGLPIPADKKAVPREVFARLFWHAMHPPKDTLLVPFTADMPARDRVHGFASLFLRPRVSPEVPGRSPYRDMEIRFFAPGTLVSNLDFVESIFGNAGDPYLPANDPGLDAEHFCGVSGLVVLAPHLNRLTKKELGLPHVSKATARQKRDGMCWEKPGELYNDGGAFKATFRTAEGLIATVIVDNYYGYCKKEVKTQIGFAANLTGGAEEEHSGGAMVYPSYNLGDVIRGASDFVGVKGYTFARAMRLLRGAVAVHPDGYAVDRRFPEVIYIPENADISLADQSVRWRKGRREVSILLAPGKVYIYPSGYKARLERHPGADTWRLVGTRAEGVLCHKPCTVSGGGKSEISKSVADGILYRNVYVQDLKKDFDLVDRIIRRDYSDRFRVKIRKRTPSRPFLSPKRSLGSVVRLLTPSPEYTDAYNRWLAGIPSHVRNLALLVKRGYRPEWKDDYRKHFSVDLLDGKPGNELVFEHRHMMNSYLKSGADPEGNWMVFRLRSDYVPARKLQVEDDITVSVTLPAEDGKGPSRKFVENCEWRLFQRPDDAIHPGKDKQAERDLAGTARFISNFEPLPVTEARRIVDHAIELERFTAPMQERIRAAAAQPDGWFIASNRPRLVNGKPTPNVRYLQDRPDVADPLEYHVAEMGLRLRRGLRADDAPLHPVQAVLVGRRNNPPEKTSKGEAVPPLAVYNPLHYQELPEAFMDFIASLTGKSPSTTGAGSEGAMTKGPFNALRAIHDLNNAFVSYALTGLQVFSTPAGHVGHKYQVDHDISLLMPEIWARLNDSERDATYLISEGYLEHIEDFKSKGRTVEASRLGWRITEKFLHAFFGRVFGEPTAVFPADMLRPELQGRADFEAGVANILEGQRKAAKVYFEDGGVDAACPPLKALLHIMVHGSHEGMTRHSPEFRAMFTRASVLKSSWYRERLARQQARDLAHWHARAEDLRAFLATPHNRRIADELGLKARLAFAERKHAEAARPAYLRDLVGTLGLDALE